MNSGEFHAAVDRLFTQGSLAVNSGMAKLSQYGSDDDDEDEVENARRLSPAPSEVSTLGFHDTSQPASPHSDDEEFTGFDFPQQRDTFHLDEDEDNDYEESVEGTATAAKEDAEIAKVAQLELAKIAKQEEAKAARAERPQGTRKLGQPGSRRPTQRQPGSRRRKREVAEDRGSGGSKGCKGGSSKGRKGRGRGCKGERRDVKGPRRQEP